jgi:flagellar biosynthesis/type III secretory pathway protein FliH
MSTYSDISITVPDDSALEAELEDDLPRGPRAGTLSQRVTFGIALGLVLALAAGAAAMAYTVGKATQSEPAAKVDVTKRVATARAGALDEGKKIGYQSGFAAGLEKGTNAAAEKSYNRGFSRGKKKGLAQGLRDGRRRGFSDGVDSTAGKYQRAIADLTAALQQSQKDLAAAEKAAKAAKAANPVK